MKNVSFILFALATFLLTSCEDNLFNRNCLENEGAVVTRTIDVATFTGISLHLPAEVILTQGAEQKIEIETTENVINEIENDSKVEGGMWVIQIQENCVDLDEELKIFIQTPTIEAIDVFGAGEVRTNGTFTDLALINIDASGASKFDLTVENLQHLTIAAAGAADFRLAGNVETANLRFDGASKIKAFDLEMKELALDAFGAIEGEINVTEELLVTLSGAGKVCYKGSPSISTNISGAGELNDCN